VRKVTIAIILAAGRGKRLGNLGESSPKCLLEIAGKTILEWSATSLKSAGISLIYLVSGYRSEQVESLARTLGIRAIHNPEWDTTDMVYSLMLALNQIESTQKLLVVYADILFHSNHVSRLLKQSHDIAITYDRDWLRLWQLRFEQPLDDAESFRVNEGVVTDIGSKSKSVKDIQGQFMGLMLLRSDGQKQFEEAWQKQDRSTKNRIQLTQMLQLLMKNGAPPGACPISGNWCEVDSQTDVLAYQRQLAGNQRWSHDWRATVQDS
jgi:choline kinase